MTRIITHNNTRYRTTAYIPPGETVIVDAILNEETGTFTPMGRDPFTDTATESFTNDDWDDGILLALERLPEIEDWPGHHPEQYLTDDPDTPVKPGDLCAHIYWDGRAILERASPGGCISTLADLHSDMKPADCKTYLISRADPTEDA